MRRGQPADYVIRKDKQTGEWNVQWRNNPPIKHYSFDDARQTLIDLLRLEIHWKVNKRGNRSRTEEMNGNGNTGTGAA